jgi:hypothetical protein
MSQDEQLADRRVPTGDDTETRGHRAPEGKAHMQPHPIIEGQQERPDRPPPPPPEPIPGVENIARPTPPAPESSEP